MAERYAVATGIWEAATFNGGTLPAVDDTVHANGYTVTVDQDIAVAALSTRVGATAVAGGGFSAISGVTITANLYAGTNHCLACSGSTGTRVVYGTAYGSNTTSSVYALRNTGAANVVMYGNVFADVGRGANITSTGHLYVYGDATGGAAYDISGLLLSGTSTGNIYLYGTARSSATGVGAGAYNSSIGTGCILIQAAETGAGGGWPYIGKVLYHDLNNLTLGVRNAAGTLKTIGVLPHSSFSTPRAFT